MAKQRKAKSQVDYKPQTHEEFANGARQLHLRVEEQRQVLREASDRRKTAALELREREKELHRFLHGDEMPLFDNAEASADA